MIKKYSIAEFLAFFGNMNSGEVVIPDQLPSSLSFLHRPAVYGKYLLCIAGLGGLLYGIDIGIISAALIYLEKTVDLTVTQTSAIVAAVLGGSMFSSLIAGLLADWFGRKTMMIVSGLLFVASVALIALSQGFVILFLGRFLQGLSGGVIAVVVPLYLAECLSAAKRGQGSAIFQFMLTFGIVVAALTGWFFIHRTEAAIAAAAGNATLIHAAQDHAWRGMFLSIVVPGLMFFAGSFFLSESPRWLLRRNREADAQRALLRALPPSEAELELQEMRSAAGTQQKENTTGSGSLLQRKYVFPFVLACLILGLNQATGINSILAYLAVILKQAGMTADHATQGDLAVKVLNCVMTIVAVALVDRKGRKFLLSIGTGGIVVSLALTALLFHSFESQRTEQKVRVQQMVQADTLEITPSQLQGWGSSAPTSLEVLYSYGNGDKLVALSSTDHDPLVIHPEGASGKTLEIRHAFWGPLPGANTGWLVAGGLALFIAFYSMGPGVVVWLTLSELMPTRIRSAGMGIALLLNQGVSTLIAGIFLPIASSHGYQAMLILWSGCTLIYFLVAVLLLPETKGKTLEEIELAFEQR